MTENPTPPAASKWKPWHKKTLIGIGIAFVFFLLVGMCAGDPDQGKPAENAPVPSSTAPSPEAATPSAEEAPEAVPEPPNPPNDATADVIPTPQGEQVAIKFPVSDNFTHGMIVSGAQEATIDLLKWARETYPSAASVLIEGTAPLTDEYGNTETRTALSVVYNADTLSRINFDGVDRKDIWNLRDAGFVGAALS